jgi:hypothetical protein
MPSQGLASPYLAKFAPHERQDRVEPELGPSTVPRTAYPAVTSDSPAAAGLSSEVSDFDTEPRLFEFITRQAQLTSVPGRSAPAKRPHVGTVFLSRAARSRCCRDRRRFLWRRPFPAHTTQEPYRCRCRAGVSRCGRGCEHGNGYYEPWRTAGNNRRFRRDRPAT